MTERRLSDIGMVGMAVMGENLALNMEEKGFQVSVFDVREGIVDGFLKGRGSGKNFTAAHSWQELVSSLVRPRRIMLMIRAGKPVDEVLDILLPLLDDGDIVIDGGNSHFADTQRRTEKAAAAGKLFIGTGVSGGEEGARKGPSMMPGGNLEAWETVKPILTAICAKVEDGSPCCAWVGEGGAGHFVKMVHNGIEYGDMELICEAYHYMKNYLGLSNERMSQVFEAWNQGRLCSYLIEITAKILKYKEENGEYLIDRILDTAGQKGTGKWTGIAALEEGVPLTLISEAVFARCLSAIKEERVQAAGILKGPDPKELGAKLTEEEIQKHLAALEDALYAAKILSYAQGYSLMRTAAKTYGWNLAFGDIALMWRGGCIIRSVFLGDIKKAFDKDPNLSNLLMDPFFAQQLDACQTGLRTACANALLCGLPMPAMTSALSYYDGYRAERLPANLLQAQRDFFGAHTYERLDRERGVFFHTDWTGEGGGTASSSYTV